jgi:hypothetical protein
MDPARLRKRVWLQLASAPLTVLPAVAGATALLAAWGVDAGSGWLAFLGVSGLLASVGSLATQCIFYLDEHTRRAFASLEAEALAEQERKLDNLYRRLRKDDDPRDDELLKQLRSLYRTFQQDTEWVKRMRQQSAVEIASQVEKLFQASIISLQRSLDLARAADRMATDDGRRTALLSRDRLLSEVQESIAQMAKTIDGVQSLGLERNGDDLARIRRELDESLNVARRVEERLQTEFGNVEFEKKE